ncbi:damage-control phosphatase ARMT1 [Brachionichthys hirsutus]|uniref:damage-control phosphatase ARMT1 n=1 Tax=Brachionichthys hirsutus TaxID=412623 RepID=UPI0036047E71
MAADQTAPVSLSARVVGSFAYLTVRDRMPTILTKVIDTIHRNRGSFLEQHGEEGIEAEKKTIALLSKLRNEMQTDKPVLAVTDGLPDAGTWNRYLQVQQRLQGDREPVSWFRSPWLYVECYMYRRIQEALWLSPPISDYDVFSEGKTLNYLQSQQAVMTLCSYSESIRENMAGLSHKQLSEYFTSLLQVSLWGNKCDLSVSSGRDNSQKTSPVDSLSGLQPFILVDDSKLVWTALTAGQPAGRVDIVLDNAGFELVTDLVLADFLICSGLVREVRFHGKSFPWFVSDVTAGDFRWTIGQATAADHEHTSQSGLRWQSYVRTGAWSYRDHPFWTQPHAFCDMEADAPDLYTQLQAADLVLFKGDLNYRKLTGDRDWDHAASFAAALRGFGPAPLCSLRTLKANVQVGLQPGQGGELTCQDPNWMTTGMYAVIQFYSPRAED